MVGGSAAPIPEVLLVGFVAAAAAAAPGLFVAIDEA